MAPWPLHIGRSFEHARRYRHIMAVLMKYGFSEVVSRLHRSVIGRFGKRSVPRRVRSADGSKHTTPERVRMALEELGPTFIKLGQLLSTRPDLIPPEYVEELTKLQDQVPPEKFARIRAVLEEDLGQTIGEVFVEFDDQCIAAGSIAQVHRAVLPGGRVVVVKVTRPGIQERLAFECDMLKSLADWLGTVNDASGKIDLPRMAREFTEAVSLEVDMTVERRNLQQFGRNFKDDPTVHVPEVVPEFCTKRVLAMEYIDGIKPRSRESMIAAGLDPQVLASRGADFVLKQIFEYGLFHSDPHPGNMLMLDGNIVVPIDFGQVARLRSGDRELLSELVLGIVDHDVDAVLHAFRTAELLDDETDTHELAADAEELIDRYYNLPLEEIPLREVINEMFSLIRKHEIKPPAQFTLMLKSLMTIETLAVTLDPQFDTIEALKPFARRFRLQQLDPRQYIGQIRSALRETAQFAGRFPEDARAIIRKVRKGDFQLRVHHEHLEALVSTLDKSSNRISFAVIIAALLVASSMLTPQEGLVLGFIPLQIMGVVGYCVAAVMGVWLLISILRGRHF